MSNKELDRLTVMKALDLGTIKQRHAAEPPSQAFVERLRQGMIAEGNLGFKQRKTKQVFQMRKCRSRLGEWVQERARRMSHTNITVCEGFSGTVFLPYQGRKLGYSTYQKAQRRQPIENEKTINLRVNQALEKQAERTQLVTHPGSSLEELPEAHKPSLI